MKGLKRILLWFLIMLITLLCIKFIQINSEVETFKRLQYSENLALY